MKHKILCLMAATLCVVACSDDDEGGGNKVTGPLSTPENVVYTPTENSIHFGWSAVENATSYEATLSPEETPSDKETINTTDTQCDFENLDGGYYVFTLMAIYADNPEFNSAVYETRVATLGLGVEPLATPENLECTEVSSHEATLTWDAVSGAAAYAVSVTASGTEVLSEIVATNTYTATGLESATRYSASVKALLNADGTESEYDSSDATVSFTTIEGLIAPSVVEYLTTYGISILEWDLTVPAQGQQALSNTDPYDFRLKDEDGNVLRLVENYADWNFIKYKYKRFVFGGLEPNTSYILGMRRLSTSSAYGASDWVEVPIMTEAAPDKSDYLLYWDFENVPMCANAQYFAYGCDWTGNSETDYSSPYNFPLKNSGNTAPIWIEKINPNSSSGRFNQSFCDAYLPGLDYNDFVNEVSFNVGVGPGHMKFGSGSDPAWLTLPALDIDGTANIVVEFETSPYCEPSTSGDKFTPSNPDVLETFTFEVTGDGTIDASSLGVGEYTTSSTVAILRLPTLEEGRNYGYGDDCYYFLPHSVTVTGATSNTRIKIYTALKDDDNNYRMWLDNLTVHAMYVL